MSVFANLTAEQWPAVNALLDEALVLAPAERDAFVQQLDGDRAQYRDTLRALLAQAGSVETDQFLATLPRFTQVASSGPLTDLAAGEAIGPYRLIRELGVGGMGAVWLAERADGSLKRQVALKLPRLAWGKGLAERMARERDILASLEHPHIARLYDAGVDQHGRPYLALEYVEGQPIDVYAKERALSVKHKLDLLLQVCAAVAFAHSRLVVHRDLKPSNILVTADGQVRLLDFGIAKLMEGESTQVTQLTQLAGRALTLDYASPEQIKGEPIGTASDVYSLGVVAYELLTEAKPYRLKRGSAAELEEAIATVDAPKASDAATAPASKKALSGDLDAILNKALKKRATDRYATIDALAQDLTRHLNSEPVSAQPDAFGYRARKFLSRYRYQSLGALALLLAGTTVVGTVLWQSARVQAEARRAEAAQAFLLKLFQANSRNQTDPMKARETPARELLQTGARQLIADEQIDPAVRSRLLAEVGILLEEMSLHADAVPVFEAQVRVLRARGREPELAAALTNLAAAMQQANRFDDALPVLREAERLLVNNGLARSRSAGVVYSYLSRQLVNTAVPESDAYARRAVEVLRETGTDNQALFGALMTLAEATRTDQPIEAEAYAREGFDVAMRMHGPEHELVATTAMWLADFQANVLRLEDARANYVRAEKIAVAKVAPDHYLRVQLDLRYGLLLSDMGNSREAIERLERARAVVTRSRGAEDMTYLPWALGNLAVAQRRAGALVAARDAAAQSYAKYAAKGPEVLAAKSAEQLLDVCLQQRDLDCIAKSLADAQRHRKASGTDDKPGFREGLLMREAEFNLLRSQWTAAQPGFEAVITAKVPPAIRFKRYQLDASVGLARALAAQGRNDEAKDALTPVLALTAENRRLFAEPLAQALHLRASLQAAAGQCAQSREDAAALSTAWSNIGTLEKAPAVPFCAAR